VSGLWTIFSSGKPENSNVCATAGQAGRNTISVSDNALQPKLVFSLKGKELDRSVTLYQSILQDQINAGSDIILDMQFWRSVHDITFRTAANPETDRTALNPEADSPKDSSTAMSSKNDSTTGFKWQMLPFFSSMLLGKLPCKLDRSCPLYDILFMLHILEGLNRYSFHLASDERNHSFAQGTITNLDDLKAVVFSIPQQEFVSAKLTDKLEQQMHDPLVSRSCCLPLWCTELMSACPFLFSFEARWKYFQLAAFGSLKNHYGHIMDAIVNSVTERGSPHSRKKFKVDRDDILVSAAEMMKSYAKSNALLEVEYKEEVGTGLGPTMEFYTLISHEFQKSGLGMWRGELPCEAVTNDAHVSRFVVAPKGLFPRPWSASADCASFQEVSKQFHLLGQVVAKAIKDGRILDIPFSKAFYKLILGQVSLSLHPSICIHLLFFLCVYQKIISSFLRSLIYMTSSHLILSWQYPLWSFKPLLVGENMQSQI
jgi:E3 ubiquitin-protein ligase TRIP12